MADQQTQPTDWIWNVPEAADSATEGSTSAWRRSWQPTETRRHEEEEEEEEEYGSSSSSSRKHLNVCSNFYKKYLC